MDKGNGGETMKKEKQPLKKENFLKILSSMTPEEVTDFILKKSKIKIITNVVKPLK